MKLFCIFLAIIFFTVPAFGGESLKDRVSRMEGQIQTLREEVNAIMTGTIIPVDLAIDIDGEDPGEPGDIKIVMGTLVEIDDCDTTTQWSVHSGAGVTIELDNAIVYEGTGSIKVNIPMGVTAIIKATKSSGSWDISTNKYLKVALREASSVTVTGLFFGEAAYDEQSKTTGVSPTGLNWSQISWDISGIAAASRNGVTMFAVRAVATRDSTLWIDYVFGDPGPSSVAFYDGDRVGHLNPPYVGTYTATATDPRTITLPRKGTVKSVLIAGDTTLGSYFATSDMSAKAKLLSGAAVLASGQITEMGDGYFIVSGNCNSNGVVYYYQVTFAD